MSLTDLQQQQIDDALDRVDRAIQKRYPDLTDDGLHALTVAGLLWAAAAIEDGLTVHLSGVDDRQRVTREHLLMPGTGAPA